MKFKKLTALLAAAVLLGGAGGYFLGGSRDTGLRGYANQFGDINGDGEINASDAALILVYAAYHGAGGEKSLDAWLAEQTAAETRPAASEPGDEPDTETAAEPDVLATEPQDAPESLLSDTDDTLTILSWNPCDIWPMAETYNKQYADGGTTVKIVSLDSLGADAPAETMTYLNSGEDIDIFCAEPDWIRLFIDDPAYTIPLSELGITEADFADSYPLAVELGKNSQGELMAATDFLSLGFFAYNTRLASECLGVDSPEEMQEKVADWDSFEQTAKELQDHGVKVTATLDGMWHSYAWNTDYSWVRDNRLMTGQAESFLTIARRFGENGYVDPMLNMWTDDWAEYAQSGNVLGYFYANWTLYPASSYAYSSGDTWNIVPGPDNFFWGGSMMCVAAQCNNKDTAADFLRTFTVDADRIVPYMEARNKEQAQGFYMSSNRKAVERYMQEIDGSCDLLGGQDPFPVLDAVASGIRWNSVVVSPYDLDMRNDFTCRHRDMDWRTDEEIMESFREEQYMLYPELN